MIMLFPCAYASFESPDMQSVTQQVPHPGFVQCVDWNPRGEVVATGCADGYLRVVEAATGTVLCALQHPAGVRALAWSASGEVASGCLDGAVRVFAVAAVSNSVSARWVKHRAGDQVASLTWRPIGDRVACVWRKGAVSIFDAILRAALGENEPLAERAQA